VFNLRMKWDITVAAKPWLLSSFLNPFCALNRNEMCANAGSFVLRGPVAGIERRGILGRHPAGCDWTAVAICGPLSLASLDGIIPQPPDDCPMCGSHRSQGFRLINSAYIDQTAEIGF
jgi:hypothetical protein